MILFSNILYLYIVPQLKQYHSSKYIYKRERDYGTRWPGQVYIYIIIERETTVPDGEFKDYGGMVRVITSTNYLVLVHSTAVQQAQQTWQSRDRVIDYTCNT